MDEILTAAAASNKGNSCSRQLRPALQYLPLYCAFFLSVTAITFSIRAYNSTHFVLLGRPIRVSPYFKSISHVGLMNWELCAIEQEALDMIVDQAGEHTAPIMIELRSPVVPTTEIQSNTTTYVRTTYHFTPHAIESSVSWSWFEAPVHDDILVDADYPYNDDDEILASFPAEYWSCHTLRFNSRNIVNDRLWIMSRFFFTSGAVIGFSATILLAFLLVLRAKDVDTKRLCCQEESSDRTSSQNDLAIPSFEERKEKSIMSIETEMQMLDTNASGCRQIAVCFLIAYLMQSLTLLFLNGKVCVSQQCSLSSGARSLITSCVLWVSCAMLLIFMLSKRRKNEKRLRQMRRQIAMIKERQSRENNLANELRRDRDNDVLDSTFDTSDNSDSSDIAQKEDV